MSYYEREGTKKDYKEGKNTNETKIDKMGRSN